MIPFESSLKTENVTHKMQVPGYTYKDTSVGMYMHLKYKIVIRKDNPQFQENG